MMPHLTNVLIVDDNIYNLQVTSKLLQRVGYRIDVAKSGKDALNQLEIQKPDLILLDIMMPELNGIEVCKIIKQVDKWKEIPVIFLSSLSQTEDMVSAFNAGGVDYIIKPFHKEEMLLRVKTHINLYKSKLQVEENNRVRDQLYSVIAHDVKIPFSDIMLTVNALNSNRIHYGSEECCEILNHLENSTKNTYNLLDNLLTWTKYQSGAFKPEFCLADLNLLVLETVQLLQPVALKKKICFELDIKEECLVYVDKVSIKTIIRNLLSNAIKFSHTEGIIDIETHQIGCCKWLMIKDGGVGMPQDIMKQVFNQKSCYTTIGTNNENGNGLGMQIVKDFVKLNNGKLSVESEVGKGTQISLAFSKDFSN